MFDLEAHVSAWRELFKRSLGDRPDALDELESHLRDDFAAHVAGGLPAERAWSDAVARLGKEGPIAAEFRKGLRASRLPAQIAAFAVAFISVCVAGVLTFRTRPGKFDALLTTHVFFIAVGYVVAFAVGATCAASLLFRSVVRGKVEGEGGGARRRGALVLAAAAFVFTAVGVMLGAFWAKGHLGRGWGWDPREVGGLCVLATNALLLWSLVHGGTWPIPLFIGVTGNIVVSLAWFGPPLLQGARHAVPPFGVYLLAFVLSQLADLLLGAIAEVRSKVKQSSPSPL